MIGKSDDDNTTSERELIAILRLVLTPKIGPKTVRNLIEAYGTGEAAIAALPEKFNAIGRDQSQITSADAARHRLRVAHRLGFEAIHLTSKSYPARLRHMDAPPAVLWSKGARKLLERPCLAVVGARNASALGIRLAHRISQSLSEKGVIIASGLARGIDAAAHHAALPHGTIAVQAGGLDIPSPPQNAGLQQQIHMGGLALSEQNLGVTPLARHFPRRNLILAGLCEGVLVIEAANGSGTLITANAALDLGREVLAIPGHPFDSRSAGANNLIRDGATLVRSAEDVLDAMPNLLSPTRSVIEEAPLPEAQTRQPELPEVSEDDPLAPLDATPILEEEFLQRSPVSREKLLRQLVEEELNGRIARHAGGYISRVA